MRGASQQANGNGLRLSRRPRVANETCPTLQTRNCTWIVLPIRWSGFLCGFSGYGLL
jgi:hypothetical protein